MPNKRGTKPNGERPQPPASSNETPWWNSLQANRLTLDCCNTGWECIKTLVPASEAHAVIS
jgi:hypothetical protein